MTASTELLPSVRLKVSLALRCTLTVYFVPAKMQMVQVQLRTELTGHLTVFHKWEICMSQACMLSSNSTASASEIICYVAAGHGREAYATLQRAMRQMQSSPSISQITHKLGRSPSNSCVQMLVTPAETELQECTTVKMA